MKYSFTKYPLDILICLLISTVLIPLVIFDVTGLLRIMLGLPCILFIPGYVLVFALFPQKKTTQGVDTIERIALSFGLSIAVVPLLGLMLNYTVWGIRTESILFSSFIFIFAVSCIGLYRWFRLASEQRFIITLNFLVPASENKFDKALSFLLVIIIVVTLFTLIYVIVTPRDGERFTEFYILGPGGIADDYPSSLVLGQNATGYIGLVNHEHRTMNYTVEVWFLKQDTFYNETSLENETVFLSLRFLDKIEVTLDHTPVDMESAWTAQWQQYFSYMPPETGLGKLLFLLFTDFTDEYTPSRDYVFLAEDKINDAYLDLHIWLTVTHTSFYLLDSDGDPESYTRILSVGENVSGIIGIINNELRVVNYTVDMWLVNQTTVFDESLQENVTVIHNMWYLDGVKVQLNYTDDAVAWEQHYSVPLHRAGEYELMFFVYTTPSELYMVGLDYKDRASLIFAAAQLYESIVVMVT